MAGSKIRTSLLRVLGGHTGTGGSAVSGSDDKRAGFAEAIRRHPAVNGFVLARLDDIGFVPDADIASAVSQGAAKLKPSPVRFSTQLWS